MARVPRHRLGHARARRHGQPADAGRLHREADRRGHGGAAAAPRHQGGGRSADSRSAATSRWSSSSRIRRWCARSILCNTGPGYRKDEARAGWNDFSIGYAKRFEERGLDGIGRGIEIDATRQYQRSAQGLAFAGRGILTQRDAKVMEHLEQIAVPTLLVWGADDAALPDRQRVHGVEDPERAQGRDRAGGARRQPVPAREVQRGRAVDFLATTTSSEPSAAITFAADARPATMRDARHGSPAFGGILTFSGSGRGRRSPSSARSRRDWRCRSRRSSTSTRRPSRWRSSHPPMCSRASASRSSPASGSTACAGGRS